MWFMVPLTFGVVCRDHILSSASSETTYTTLYTPHTLHYTHTHTRVYCMRNTVFRWSFWELCANLYLSDRWQEQTSYLCVTFWILFPHNRSVLHPESGSTRVPPEGSYQRKLGPLLAVVLAGLWFRNSGRGASWRSRASCVITDPNMLCLCTQTENVRSLALSLRLEDEAWIHSSERVTVKVETKGFKTHYKPGTEPVESTWNHFYLCSCFTHLLQLFVGKCWRLLYMRPTFWDFPRKFRSSIKYFEALLM